MGTTRWIFATRPKTEEDDTDAEEQDQAAEDAAFVALQKVAEALAAFDGGSMITALALPKRLESVPDRTAMLAGASLVAAGTLAAGALPGYGWLLSLWFVLSLGYSTAQTPSGRLLRRSANPEDRPALFAAQFVLSHACWLIAHPLSGWAGAALGLPLTAVILAAIAAIAIGIGFAIWPSDDPDVVEHRHDDLPAKHPCIEPVHDPGHANL